MRNLSTPGATLASLWLAVALAPLPAQENVAVAGTVHPVSGPAIEDGVVLVRGDRIVAVGPRDLVEIPTGATVLAYPQGHVYPGLVDALTDAFADDSVLDDTSADAGTRILDGLDRHEARSQELVTYGVTTAYVRNQADVRWRGIGAVLRPRIDGYVTVEAAQPAVQMLLAATGDHPLDRQKSLASADDALRAIEAYEKRFADHQRALAEYQTKYAEYLEYYRARGGAPAAEQQGGGRRGSGRRGRGQGGARGQRGEEGQGGGGRRRGGDPGEAQTGTDRGSGGTGSAEAPTKPEFPEPPDVEPDKEALRQVLAGERALRIEVQRADEVRAALRLAKQYGISRVVLENAAAAAPMAADLARQGIPVVLADILPGPDSGEPESRMAELDELPARLAAADVAIAIASGSVRRARHLSLLAARAVGQGVDPDLAIRAITLTPAEILGVSREVGSLEAGKLADIVVFSAPIFSSDARVLRVISAGSTQYEAR